MNHLKDILSKIMKTKIPGYSQKENELLVFSQWEIIVGDRISKQCWPVKWLSDDTLLIAAESSAWLHQLKIIEKELIKKIIVQLNGKNLKKLVFKIDTRKIDTRT